MNLLTQNFWFGILWNALSTFVLLYAIRIIEKDEIGKSKIILQIISIIIISGVAVWRIYDFLQAG